MNKPSIPSIDLVSIQQSHENDNRLSSAQFLRLVKARGLSSGVVIGVGFGGHCENLLEYRGIDTLVGVDPYQAQTNLATASGLNASQLEQLYPRVLDRLARFGRRFELMRSTSNVASMRFNTPTFDFVYIDHQQGYEAVIADLASWFDSVRVGGIFAGKDYDNPERPCMQQAVDGFFQRLGWDVHHAGDGMWWVHKKALAISYIIPAYNAEHTLWQSATSAFVDNMIEGDELIIIDDGSTDATGDVIEGLLENYPCIRVIRHAENQGAGAVRNFAIELASNNLIFMLDADNVLPADTIEPLREYLMRRNADAACFAQIRLFRDGDEPGQTAWVHHYPPGNASFEQYCTMQDPPGAAGNLLFTRDAWRRAGGYPEHVGALDSWGFGLRLVATGSHLAVCPEGFYDHRVGHESYWQREHRPGKTDRLALSLLRPYFGRLSTSSQIYLLQGENQDRWFSELAERPLRVEGESRGRLLPTLSQNIHALGQRIARLVTRAA